MTIVHILIVVFTLLLMNIPRIPRGQQLDKEHDISHKIQKKRLHRKGCNFDYNFHKFHYCTVIEVVLLYGMNSVILPTSEILL